MPILILLLLLTLTEAQENKQWLQELQTLVPPSLLHDVRQLALLDEHKAHDALAAIKQTLEHNEPLTPVINYGVVVPHKLYRGAQPSPTGLKWLKQQGITTIVLLREPGVEETNYPGWSRDDYVRQARELEIEVVELSIRDRTVPTAAQIQRFLATVDENEKTFVHCSAGIGRTGIMAGLYLRANDTPAKAALEQNRRYMAQPEKYLDHALQAAFMTNYPLEEIPPTEPGPPNPVLENLKTGVRLDMSGQRAVPALDLTPDADPMSLLARALQEHRLVRLHFTNENLDVLGSLSRALPTNLKMGYAEKNVDTARVRAWLGPGVPLQTRIVPFPSTEEREALARQGVVIEVENAQSLSGWYVEVLR